MEGLHVTKATAAAVQLAATVLLPLLSIAASAQDSFSESIIAIFWRQSYDATREMNTVDVERSEDSYSKPVGGNGDSGVSHGYHFQQGQNSESQSGFVVVLITLISYGLIIITFPFSLCACMKMVQEYERAVIFRLGRIKRGGAVGPGLFFIIPCMDQIVVTDLRTISFDVPPQEILTKDSVTVAVDAVVYYRINAPLAAVCNVADYAKSTKLLASTTLRTILGTKSLSDILSDREFVAHYILDHLDSATEAWGVKVERVEVKDVRLPQQLQRAMAAEAEAAREARAKVIAAEGEHKASRALKDAADILSEAPAALQLRYLQTLTNIAAEKNSTILFPLPIELLTHLTKK